MALGCATLMRDNTLSYEDLPLIADTTQTYCEKKSMALAGEHETSLISFEETLLRLEQRHLFSDVDRFVLWSLFQMNVRPESSSPTSRFQALMKNNNQWDYLDVMPSLTERKGQEVYPFLFALDHLLKKYRSNYSLRVLARQLERQLPASISIGSQLAQFLSAHKNQLRSNPTFQEAFFKAGDTLRPEESISRLPFERIVQEAMPMLTSADRYHINTHLFDTEIEGLKVRCNFDINVYQHGVYLISLHPIQNSNPFMLQGRQNNTFLAATSQKETRHKNLFNTILFKGQDHHAPMAFCLAVNPKASFAMMSVEGRDPGQLLSQILVQELADGQNLEAFDSLLRQSRAIRLYNPDRVVFESQRASAEQLEQLQTAQVPLYHAKSIGKVWASKLGAESGFLIDMRHEGHLLCQ
jgi:hypothetical protein